MWPHPPSTLKLDLKLPPELAALAARADQVLARALELAWWHGCQTGLVWGFLAGVLATALVVAIYRRRS